MKLRCHCSKEYCPNNHVNSSCKTEGNCFSQIKIDPDTLEIEKHYGCLPEEPSGRVAIFHCKQTSNYEENSVLCCYERDFCNEDLKPSLPPTKNHPCKFKFENFHRKSGLLCLLFLHMGEQLNWHELYLYKEMNIEQTNQAWHLNRAV